ncbi:MAG: hypothetical protein MJH11_14610 [Lentisphaeria bacterium]|nr:hypothetical protein [Lentisphaeria bacterium]
MTEDKKELQGIFMCHDCITDPCFNLQIMQNRSMTQEKSWKKNFAEPLLIIPGNKRPSAAYEYELLYADR